MKGQNWQMQSVVQGREGGTFWRHNKNTKQAGAELCQSQGKLEAIVEVAVKVKVESLKKRLKDILSQVAGSIETKAISIFN